MFDVTPYVNLALLIVGIVVIARLAAAVNGLTDEMRRRREERARKEADRAPH